MAKQSGVPVGTLRTWESRYGAFAPVKSSGQHRMYRPEDLHKAILLKRLCESGHSISRIAGLGMAELTQMTPAVPSLALSTAQSRLNASRVCIAVVGVGLASRIESKKFTLGFLGQPIKVSDVFFDVDSALNAQLSEPPHLLLIKVGSLQSNNQAQIAQLLAHHKIHQAIVVYNYGQQSAIDALKRAGLVLRREPVSDEDLSDLISSVLLIDAAHSGQQPNAPASIPPRKYSERTLARVAGISSSVICECPRHVAELISQLASFEQYSQDCLNKSPQDADLHSYLSAVSGSARNLFERALERVAAHEGIDLSEP